MDSDAWGVNLHQALAIAIGTAHAPLAHEEQRPPTLLWLMHMRSKYSAS